MTTMTACGDTAEFGTGLLRTTVVTEPGGEFTWRRTPGPLAPAAFVPVCHELDERLAAMTVETGGPEPARLALSDRAGAIRTYRVHGSVSVANQLLADGPSAALASDLLHLGKLLRALHEQRPPATMLGTRPRGSDRLDAWLSGSETAGGVADAASHLRELLGEARWDLLRSWSDLRNGDSEVVMAHGAPGLGSLIAGGTRGTVLLAGEDLCTAPWYFDLGWVAGELIELRWQLGGDPLAWQQLLAALFEGYGRDLGQNWNRHAALRVLLHVHDIAAYVDWYGKGFDHYAGFLTFLIDL